MEENYLNKKLRIGLLVDSFDMPNWVYAMLRKIQESDYAEIKLVVSNAMPQVKKKLFSKIIDGWNYLLYIAYYELENKIIKLMPDAFEAKDAKTILADIPDIKVNPIRTKYSDTIEDKDIENIKKYQIDVFIRLGFKILKGRILESAKFGAWSCHHADNCVNRGGPAGFWEVFENSPLTGSILQILTEDLDNGLVLYRSYSATDKVLVKRNRNKYYWKTLSFIPRKLKELHDLGEEKFFTQVRLENKHINFYSNRIYKKPRNMEFLRLFIQLAARYIKSKFYCLFFFEQWFLMFNLRKELSCSFWMFKRIVPPKDRFWADPHVIYKDNRYYIFIEELLYKSNKSHIALITMDEKGSYGKPVTVVERPYHLAYPFIFVWNKNYYMIPESRSNRTIEVYKCIEFPGKWEFHKNLMANISAVDTTLFYYQGKWWLFANVVENEGASSCDELFLFYADNPLSCDWTPHPKNPVVSDVRKSRPAGKIFEYNGNIYRPSQNCSGRYGYGLKINQIEILNESEYQEIEISSIEPDWDRKIKAIHTFNQEHELIIIDGILQRRRFF